MGVGGWPDPQAPVWSTLHIMVVVHVKGPLRRVYIICT